MRPSSPVQPAGAEDPQPSTVDEREETSQSSATRTSPPEEVLAPEHASHDAGAWSRKRGAASWFAADPDGSLVGRGRGGWGVWPVRRLGTVLCAAVLCGGLLVPATASAGTYDVVFCHELHRSFGGTIRTTHAFSAEAFAAILKTIRRSRSTTTTGRRRAARLRRSGRSANLWGSPASRSKGGCAVRTATSRSSSWQTAPATGPTPWR